MLNAVPLQRIRRRDSGNTLAHPGDLLQSQPLPTAFSAFNRLPLTGSGSGEHVTGERGRNWVRAYEKGKGGIIFLEWREPILDDEGQPVPDPKTGAPAERRKRMSTGHRDRTRAKRQADFGQMVAAPVALTLRRLIRLYHAEVTPSKSKGKQAHDQRAASLFLEFFDGRADPKRRSDRAPGSLDRKDWDEFVTERRAGKIAGLGPVRDRVIEYDVKFLIAVLSWTEGANEGDPHHIAKNPWSRERRKAQGMVMPREKNPNRPSMTEEQHEALLTHSPNWRFSLVMELCRETIHRRNSVRQIALADLDLRAGAVTWRGEYDKNGIEAVTPLTPEALAALRSAPRVLGSPWVLPSEEDPQQPVPRDTLNTWMRRAKERAGVDVKGLGFHGQKRAGVRNPAFRKLPGKVREKLTGTSFTTLDRIYNDVEMEEMRAAIRDVSGARRRA